MTSKLRERFLGQEDVPDFCKAAGEITDDIILPLEKPEKVPPGTIVVVELDGLVDLGYFRCPRCGYETVNIDKSSPLVKEWSFCGECGSQNAFHGKKSAIQAEL